MPYLSSSGELLDSRSPWRLSIIQETFWSILNFFVLFVRTIFNPSLTRRGDGYSSDYRGGGTGGHGPGGGGGRPPAMPRRRMGGFRGGGAGPAPPPMAGGG